MEIEDPDGRRLAMVKKALIAPLRDRWTVSVADGPDLDVQGNLLDYEYTIGEGPDKIAEVSKKWFRVADTYGVEIEPGQNDVLTDRPSPWHSTRWPTPDAEASGGCAARNANRVPASVWSGHCAPRSNDHGRRHSAGNPSRRKREAPGCSVPRPGTTQEEKRTA